MKYSDLKAEDIIGLLMWIGFGAAMIVDGISGINKSYNIKNKYYSTLAYSEIIAGIFAVVCFILFFIFHLI